MSAPGSQRGFGPLPPAGPDAAEDASANDEGGEAAALAALYMRAPRGVLLGLDAMQAACARVGHPERSFRAVHIAGTNGKGSVSAMVESILRAGGVRTGLYTSPHLSRFAERIQVDGEPVGGAVLARALNTALAAGPELSFFEVATLAAFIAFREAGVDLAVLEVGLGGRLDATNVIPPPVVAAVTRIAQDHADYLGTSLPGIGREKAAIAKKGGELLVGPLAADVLEAVAEEARDHGARLVTPDVWGQSSVVDAATPLGLAGEHQRENARLAEAIARRAGASDDAIRRGLEQVRWPGRLERVHTPDGVSFLLDCAHNEDGIAALARHLDALSLPSSVVTLLFGALADKAWEPMLDRLSPYADTRHYAPPRGRAPASPRAMAKRHDGVAHDSAIEACRRAVESAKLQATSAAKPLVVVAGSIYLVGEVRAYLLGLPSDPPVAL